MSDKPSKPAIPVWQQAQQPNKPSDQPNTQTPTSHAADGGESMPESEQRDAPTPDAAASRAPEAPEISPSDEQQHIDQVRTFLSDPAVKDQPLEKKRTFLQAKGIPDHLIERELSSTIISTDDFETYLQRDRVELSPSQTRSSQVDSEQSAPPPPIITYPEFLAKAHRPPPIVTLTRVVNAAYLTSAVAALCYGASTFLVKPMSAALTEARHDFSTHSQSKIDELNARLEKVVSRLPSTRPTTDDEDDENNSTASDPTELFHRDIGTQTDTAIESRATSSKKKVDVSAAADQAEKVRSMHTQLTGLLKGAKSLENTTKERQEHANKLRHYLDTVTYGGGAVNVWSNNGAGFGWSEEQTDQQKEKDKRDDAIEALKKEIRGVKGVLLSAKRFPTAGGAGMASNHRLTAR